MYRKKYSPEKIIKIIQEYLQGKGSCLELGRLYDVNHNTILNWVRTYRNHGSVAFSAKTKNSAYSSEFKTRCVEEVVKGRKSLIYTTDKYNISSTSVLRM